MSRYNHLLSSNWTTVVVADCRSTKRRNLEMAVAVGHVLFADEDTADTLAPTCTVMDAVVVADDPGSEGERTDHHVRDHHRTGEHSHTREMKEVVVAHSSYSVEAQLHRTVTACIRHKRSTPPGRRRCHHLTVTVACCA